MLETKRRGKGKEGEREKERKERMEGISPLTTCILYGCSIFHVVLPSVQQFLIFNLLFQRNSSATKAYPFRLLWTQASARSSPSIQWLLEKLRSFNISFHSKNRNWKTNHQVHCSALTRILNQSLQPSIFVEHSNLLHNAKCRKDLAKKVID